jgi:hypothetical protein
MGLWEDDNEEFRDIPDEAKLDENKNPMQSAPVNVQVQNRPAPQAGGFTPRTAPSEPEVAHFDGDPDLDLFPDGDDEEDFTSVLADANLRIEQGRLYQMIMNHELFDGMEADSRAVANVQREIRKFARESMEVMLGMRGTVPAHATIASPFNDLEVDILKKIASKATNGATESPSANQVAQTLKETPKRQTLNPIGGSTALKRSTAPARAKQPLPTKPAVPVARRRLDATIDQICAEEGVPRELVEENYKPLEKPLDQLSPAEQEKRKRETAARLAARTTVKSAAALPMATPEQREMLAIQRATQVSAGPGMSAILEAVKKMPITIKQ